MCEVCITDASCMQQGCVIDVNGMCHRYRCNGYASLIDVIDVTVMRYGCSRDVS